MSGPGCDYAACRDSATTSAGGWSFCAKHAEDDQKDRAETLPEDDVDEVAVERRIAGDRTVALTPDEVARAFRLLESRGLSSQQIADRLGVEQRTVVRWRNDHHKPYALRGHPMTTPVPAPSPLARLLEEASGHGSPKVRKLGERIEALFDDLRTLIVAEQAREEARQEVERLEQQLAEARARLKGGEPDAARRPGRPAAEGDGRTVELQCRKGCGKTVRGAQGRAAHERNCAHEPPASAESAA